MTPTPEDPTKLDLARAMEDLAAPAHVLDREGRFRWLNKAHIELFGDRRGRQFVESVAPEHKQLARTNFARTLVGRTTTIFDLVVLDRDGARLTLRITAAPLREDDQVVGSFGIGFPLGQAVAKPTSSVLDEVTPRQLEVLRLLAEGLDTPEIARRLGIADETARNHIRALLRATGAHSRLEVVLLGLRHGVVAPG